jgi:hypothetical protein
MGRSKRTKPPRNTPKPAQVVSAEPTAPPAPPWFNEVPPLVALAFVAMALGTIPYGAPMPAWYMWTMGAVGAALGIALAADPLSRWRSLTYWPVPVILGVWACSIVACDFPRDVLTRSWSMGFYAIVFVAAQVVCLTAIARRALGYVTLSVIVLAAMDLAFHRQTQHSLLRDVRGSEMIWLGNHWNFTVARGSMTNANDHVVMAVLLPLCAVTVPSRWTWGLIAIGTVASLYDAITVASRQFVAGISMGMSILSFFRLPRRFRWWTVLGIVVLIGSAALAHPATRSKLGTLAASPFGGRSILVAYALDLFENHPLFGVGPSLYGHYYALGVRDGWTFRGEPLSPVGMPWAHCLPAEIACEMGVVGLIGYATAMCVAIARVASALRRGGLSRELAVAVTAAALAMGIMSLVDVSFIKDWVRVCWWLLLGLGFSAPTLPGAQKPPKNATIADSSGL